MTNRRPFLRRWMTVAVVLVAVAACAQTPAKPAASDC